jgi:hypothetical protein
VQATFICPRTSSAIGFFLPDDEEAMRELWSQPLRIRCPHCQGFHVADYRGVYMAGVMSQFECIPADMKEARLH